MLSQDTTAIKADLGRRTVRCGIRLRGVAIKCSNIARPTSQSKHYLLRSLSASRGRNKVTVHGRGRASSSAHIETPLPTWKWLLRPGSRGQTARSLSAGYNFTSSYDPPSPAMALQPEVVRITVLWTSPCDILQITNASPVNAVVLLSHHRNGMTNGSVGLLQGSYRRRLSASRRSACLPASSYVRTCTDACAGLGQYPSGNHVANKQIFTQPVPTSLIHHGPVGEQCQDTCIDRVQHYPPLRTRWHFLGLESGS